MDQKVKRLVDRVKLHLNELYGEHIKKVILYGSHARGQATRNSDVDVLVLVDESLAPYTVDKSLSDLLYDILLDEGELISAIVIPEVFFDTHNLPFMLNVREEGVTV